MRIGKVLRIIVWSTMALVLILVLLYGLRGEGINLSFLGNVWGSFSYANSESFQAGYPAFSKGEKIDSIEIHWVEGDANVHFYDGDTLTFSETASDDLDEDETLRYRVQGNRLIIQPQAPRQGFSLSSMPRKQLKVMIPSSFQMKELSVMGISSEVMVDGSLDTAYVDSLYMETVSGGIDLKGVSGNRLKLSTISGEINGEGAFEEIETESVSGNVMLALNTMPEKLSTETVSGDSHINLPEGAFAAKMDSISGRISCDYATMAQNKSVRYLEGGPTFHFESVSGVVFIELWNSSKSIEKNESIEITKPSMPALPSIPPLPDANPENEITGGGRKF